MHSPPPPRRGPPPPPPPSQHPTRGGGGGPTHPPTHPPTAIYAPSGALQAARLCREAAKLRELQQQRDQLVGDKERLGQALAAALARADRAEAEAASLKVGALCWGCYVQASLAFRGKGHCAERPGRLGTSTPQRYPLQHSTPLVPPPWQAQVASLSSELEASQLQLRAATSAAAEALDATASAATAAQAAAAAELEAAHRRAAAALQAEIDLLRQQRAAADAAQQQLEGEVSGWRRRWMWRTACAHLIG